MLIRSTARNCRLTIGFLITLILSVSLVIAQGDIVPVSDVTGGTSVFVFRKSATTVSQKFATQARSTRTRQQRAASANRVNNQYAQLSKAAPRRARSQVVRPDAINEELKTKPKEEVSVTFAGVGEFYIDQKDYDQAIDFFREALELDGANNRAKMGLSEALAFKGNELLALDSSALAERFFNEALTYNDKNAPAYFGLAEIASDGGDAMTATANYEKALANDGELTEIYIPLGILYYQNDNLAKAEELLTKSISADAKEAQSQFYLGLVRLQQDRNEEALKLLTTAKTLDPNTAEIFYYSGEANSRLGKNKEALADFKKALELNNNYFEARYGEGSIYFEMEDYKKAADSYEQARKLRNNNAELNANLGDAYLQLNEFNQAASSYNLATNLFQGQENFAGNNSLQELTADVFARRAFALAKQCEINVKEYKPCNWTGAINSLQRSNEIVPNPNTLANLGWAYYNAGKEDIRSRREAEGNKKMLQARDTLTQAIETSTQYQQGPLLNLGRVQTDLGDISGAIKTLQKVVAQEPRWTFALNELGIAYSNNKEYGKAIEQFKKAVAQDDKFAEAHFNLGQAQFHDGKLGDAKKTHTKLKSLKREDLAVKLEILSAGVIR